MRIFWLLVLVVIWGSCGRNPENCRESKQELLQVGVGFYRGPDSLQPIDTSFTSVSAVGSNAALVGRKYGGIYRLPLPLNERSVRFVFQQNGKADTISLRYTFSASYSDATCPAALQIESVSVNPERTTYPSQPIFITDFSTNEAIIGIVVN
jgi:hypothetical protein